jgi:hypothetical protein
MNIYKFTYIITKTVALRVIRTLACRPALCWIYIVHNDNIKEYQLRLLLCEDLLTAYRINF